MRYYALLAISLLALAVGGCSLVDSFYGIGPDGTVIDPSGGPSTTVGKVADKFIPGSAAVISALGGIWAAVRGRAWKAAAVATFDVIEAGAKAGKSVKELKAELDVAHDEAGVKGIVEKVVQKYGHTPPPATVTP